MVSMIEEFYIDNIKTYKLTVGPLFVNSYIISNENNEGVVIDPGAEGEKILEFIKKRKIDIKYLINTHGHPDHTGNNWIIKENFRNLKSGIHEKDLPFLDIDKIDLFNFKEILNIKYIPEPDFYLEEGNTITLDDISIKILHTPGHTPGSISLLLENSILFSGDTLFKDSIGRTDLPGGNYSQIINSIKEKILKLSDKIKVFPGHGENTEIGYERENNPFLC